jgi:DNA recombination protein RmuC
MFSLRSKALESSYDCRMHDIIITVGSANITVLHAALAFAALLLLLLFWMTISLSRAATERTLEAAAAGERQRELDDKVAELNRIQAEMTGRLQGMAETFGSRQADLVRVVAERMDAVRTGVGQGLEAQTVKTTENLMKLNERLAVIDRAQANLSDLTNEVLILKDILANKQTRGAFGQGRMEAIVRDALPPSSYEFQFTLRAGTRPDCIIRLPGDHRPLVIDAKFPLEGFQSLEMALSDETRVVAERTVRNTLNKHVSDIAGRYLVPGETQDIALLFIPSESLYATLAEHFEDVVQKAHRAKVIIVSPSLLMMAIQVIQAIVRDARVREQAGVIQKEVAMLLDDVRRLQERSAKLDSHFRMAQQDVSDITTSAEKISRRGQRIEALEFADEPAKPAHLPAQLPLQRAAE